MASPQRVSFAGGDVWLVPEAFVEEALDLPRALAAVREAFLAHGRGEAVNVPRIRVEGRGRGEAWQHTLRAALGSPALVGGKDYTSVGFELGANWVSVCSRRTGRLLALIEAAHLSRTRTAAVVALATDLLASPAPKVLAHFGAGRISEGLVSGVLQVRPSIEEVRLVRRREEPPAWLGALPVRARLAKVEEALDGAEIVTTATSSRTPVIPPGTRMAGRHWNLAGANHPGRRELDGELAGECLPERGGFLVVEAREQAALEASEFLGLAMEGMLEWSRVPTLGEVLGGVAPVPASATHTVFKSVGVGLADMAAAAVVLQALGVEP